MKRIAEPNIGGQSLSPEFERLYEENHQLVYSAAYRVLGSTEDAEDVTQHVFTKLILQHFSPGKPKNLKAYLYRTAIHTALCVVRWRGRMEFLDTDIEALPDSASMIQDHHISGSLVDAIASLKPEIAQMVILRYVEGLTDVEIARFVGRSRVGVAMTLSRARKRLKRWIDLPEGAN